MDTVLTAEDREYLPPEMLLDRSNPGNDVYFQTMDNLRALAVNTTTRMKPRHVQVARMIHQNRANKEIAKQVRVGVQAIYNITARKDVQGLLLILRHMAHLIDGPNIAVRKNMLWRIAAENEQTDPSTAIAALRELNKVEGAYPQAQNNGPPAVNITINQKELPRTKLDD